MTSAASRLNRLPAAERGITIGDFLVPITIGERISTRARHIALIVAGALFIALSANFSIVLPGTPVPITGQTLSVLLVGRRAGDEARRPRRPSSTCVLGLFLPVYAEHRQGAAIIGSVQDGRLVLGATGGYLVGFVLAAGLVGRLAELGWDRRFGGALAALALGNLVDLPGRRPVAHGRHRLGPLDRRSRRGRPRSCSATRSSSSPPPPSSRSPGGWSGAAATHAEVPGPIAAPVTAPDA